MAETSQFGLPLLSQGQAQKSVSMNEALSIIDAVAQLRIQSGSNVSPPPASQEGEAFYVPQGAVGAWSGQAGKIAVFCNTGWRFVTPKVGWQAFNVELGTNQLFDGSDWLNSTLAATPTGSAIEYAIVELDHQISAGATNTTAPIIPNKAQVIGVTARVIEAITGSLTTWSLGTADDSSRFGTGLGIGLNSEALGMSGSPTTYYGGTPLELTAGGGDFVAGTVRLAVHFATLRPPRSV